MHAALVDSKTGLWAHGRGFTESAKMMTGPNWGRGHAWALRGLVETLTYLPANSAQARRIEKLLRELSETLIKYQQPGGFWRQVIDRPDSYEETSVTGLVSHYFARAIQQGLLPEEPYRAAAHNAFEAVATYRVSAAGNVSGGSKSTPPLPATIDYVEWDTPVNDGHAVAATIFAAAGQIALARNLRAEDLAAVCVQSVQSRR